MSLAATPLERRESNSNKPVSSRPAGFPPGPAAKGCRKSMRFKTLIVGYALALALLLFARQHPDEAKPEFTRVLDLTHTMNAKASGDVKPLETATTHMDAPSHALGSWTIDQIPAERLIAPLVLIDISSMVRSNADYQLGVSDIAHWEASHGQIPAGSVVIARTGWEARWNSGKDYQNADSTGTMHFPGFSLDSAKFLLDARSVVGLGIDTMSIDYGRSQNFEVHQYALRRGAYSLENVANLSTIPQSGGIALAAPLKTAGGSRSPVRILALLR